METTLAYIDGTIDAAVATKAANVTLGDKERAAIREGANRRVAGFKVFDEDKERADLDAAIAKKRASIDAFLADRDAVKATLAKAGVSPLAILPSKAWQDICDKTGLFRMAPDAQGRVGIVNDAFVDFPKVEESRGPKPKFWEGNRAHAAVDPLEATAKADWPAMLKRLFGGMVAPVYREPSREEAIRDSMLSRSYLPTFATLLLPQPPDDVVATLIKVDAASIPMKVAAVADAIGFRETMTELRDRVNKHIDDEDARIAQLLYEPFIYTEHGNATAIIAQFGEFPIEKEVVDMVVASDGFLDGMRGKVTTMAADTVEYAYMNSLQNQMSSLMNYRGLQRQQGLLSRGNALGDFFS